MKNITRNPAAFFHEIHVDPALFFTKFVSTLRSSIRVDPKVTRNPAGAKALLTQNP